MFPAIFDRRKDAVLRLVAEKKATIWLGVAILFVTVATMPSVTFAHTFWIAIQIALIAALRAVAHIEGGAKK